MNQRREPRIPTNQPVQVTILDGPDRHMPAIIRNASGRGVGLELNSPLATGTALKIALEDAILLGEVIYCQPRDGKWYTGVEVEHALCGLAELAAVLRDFTAEYLGAERPDTVEHARRKHE